MTKKRENEWTSLNYSETFKKIKGMFDKQYKREGLEETYDHIGRELQWFGRYLQCRMDKEYPYEIKYRLIGDKNYYKDRPKDYIEEAKKMLYHYRKK